MNNKKVLIVFAVLVLLAGGLFLFQSTRSEIVKPVASEDVTADAGAILYKAEPLYAALNYNESVIANIRKDLDLFARKTSSTIFDSENLVGFTVTDGPKNEGENLVFMGGFYGIDGEIKLLITRLPDEMVRLSITNTTTNTNIDESLSLNGPNNRLIESLPVELDYYSIRYLAGESRVVVVFYEGFIQSDVDASLAHIKKFYANGQYDDSFINFTINGIGTFPLETIAQYLENPEQFSDY